MPISLERIQQAVRRLREEAGAAYGTAEGYIREKLEAARAAALQRSRERTEPAVPMVSDALTRADAALIASYHAYNVRQALDQMTENYKKGLDYVVDPSTFGQKAIYGGTRIPDQDAEKFRGAGYMGANDSDAYNHWRLAMLREAAMQDSFAEKVESDPTMKVPGLSCIYTATDNYGNKYRVSGNQTFFQDPERFGFIQIPFSEARPGDIVQDTYPTTSHAMILDSIGDDGVHLYNYSGGGVSSDEIKKNVRYYPSEDNDANRNAFRFVGTPADSLRWRREFNQNGFALGGNMFYGGGDKEIRQNGDVAASVKTEYLPDISTAAGKALAKKMADNVLSGSMNIDSVPRKYYSYVDGEVRGAQPMRDAINNEGVKTAVGTVSLPLAVIAGAEAAPLLAKAAPAVSHTLGVMANPATANTAAGALTATALDAYGFASGLSGLSNDANKALSGDYSFADVPYTLMNATTLIPGSSNLTNLKNIDAATNQINNISALAKRKLYDINSLIDSRREIERLHEAQRMFNLNGIDKDVFALDKKPGDIESLGYFMQEVPHVKVRGNKIRVKHPDSGRKYTIRSDSPQEEVADLLNPMGFENVGEVLRQISKDAKRLNPGNKVRLSSDGDLSIDSYPLLQRVLLKNVGEGKGRLYPVLDNGTYRMIRLNEYGKNKKSLKRIDDGIVALRKALGDDLIPSRVSFGKQHFVPAIEFEAFNRGGSLLRKYEGGGYVSDGGELGPAVVKPNPVRVDLYTDRITKQTPITHSSLQAGPKDGTDPYGIWISKGSSDPTYNLLSANCSDATGEILEALSGTDFTSGITTPYGVRRKAREVFGSYPYYRETPGKTAHQSFYVPWYDYRRAKDIANSRQLEVNLETARRNGASPEQLEQIRNHWNEEHPALSYSLDDNGNVVYYGSGGE